MRVGALVAVVWLIIGVVAGGQRGYYNGDANCNRAATIVVTVLAGPLNYIGVNPKVACHVPRPSKGQAPLRAVIVR